MSQEFVCQYEDHYQNAIIGFCTYAECKAKFQACCSCFIDKHLSHREYCITIQDIKERSRKALERISNLMEQLQRIFYGFTKSDWKKVIDTGTLGLCKSLPKWWEDQQKILIELEKNILEQNYLMLEKISLQKVMVLTNPQFLSFIENVKYPRRSKNTKNSPYHYISSIKDFCRSFKSELELLIQSYYNLIYCYAEDDLYRSADEFFKEGFFTLTILCLKRVEIKTSAVWCLQGHALCCETHFSDAIQCYDQAISADPDNIKIMVCKGLAQREWGKYEEAIQTFDQILKINTQLDYVIFGKGEVLFRLKEYEKALKCFQLLTKITPCYSEDERVLQNIGETLQYLNHFEEAIEHFDKVIEHFDKELCTNLNQYFNVLYSKGVCLTRLNQHEDAQKISDQIIEKILKMNLSQQMEYQTIYLCSLNNSEMGSNADIKLSILDKEINNNPFCHKFWNEQAYRLKNFGYFEKAKSCINKAIILDPKQHNYHILKGSILEEQGLAEDALTCYNTAISLNPKVKKGYIYKEKVLTKLHKEQQADEVRQQIQNLQHEDQPVFSILDFQKPNGTLEFDTVLINNLDVNETEKLLACYKLTNAIQPKMNFFYEECCLLSELGKWKEMIIVCDQWNNISPCQQSYLFYGWALLSLEQYEDAIKMCDQSLRMNGDSKSQLNKLRYREQKYTLEIEALGQTDQIVELYRSVANSNSPLGYQFLGIELCKIKKFDEAFKNLQKFSEDKSFSQYKDKDITLNWKGASLIGLNRYDDAIKCCDQSIAINQTYYRPHLFKGIALSHLNKFVEAVECYDVAIASYPTPDPDQHFSKTKIIDKLRERTHDELYIHKGIALQRMNKLEEALKCFNQAIDLNPTNYESYLNKGNVLELMNNSEEAQKCYDQAIKINPNKQQIVQME